MADNEKSDDTPEPSPREPDDYLTGEHPIDPKILENQQRWDAHLREQMKKRADRIRVLRSMLHVSQEQLARLVGVSWTSVSKWESGERQPGKASQRILRILEGASMHAKVVWLIHGKPPRDPLLVLSEVILATNAAEQANPNRKADLVVDWSWDDI